MNPSLSTARKKSNQYVLVRALQNFPLSCIGESSLFRPGPNVIFSVKSRCPAVHKTARSIKSWSPPPRGMLTCSSLRKRSVCYDTIFNKSVGRACIHSIKANPWHKYSIYSTVSEASSRRDNIGNTKKKKKKDKGAVLKEGLIAQRTTVEKSACRPDVSAGFVKNLGLKIKKAFLE